MHEVEVDVQNNRHIRLFAWRRPVSSKPWGSGCASQPALGGKLINQAVGQGIAERHSKVRGHRRNQAARRKASASMDAKSRIADAYSNKPFCGFDHGDTERRWSMRFLGGVCSNSSHWRRNRSPLRVGRERMAFTSGILRPINRAQPQWRSQGVLTPRDCRISFIS